MGTLQLIPELEPGMLACSEQAQGRLLGIDYRVFAKLLDQG